MKRAVPFEMAKSERGGTLADLVYDSLKADIIWGRLEPDHALRSDEVQRAYGVGVSPLREALSRLASEALVIRSAQRGFRVASLTAQQIIDTAEMRVVVEEEALRRSIELGDLAWETGIAAAIHSLTRTLYSGEMLPESEAWAVQHRRFHFALISACQSEWLLRVAANLFDHAERHRLVGERSRIKHEAAGAVGGRDRIREHERIASIVLSRDADTAADLMRRHLLLTAQSVIVATGVDPVSALRLTLGTGSVQGRDEPGERVNG